MARPQVEMRYLDVEPPKLQLRLAIFSWEGDLEKAREGQRENAGH
jgi:hypothetical protein